MNSLPRLLVAGVGPLPPERPERLFAPGLRIWGIARELARAGHEVRLVCAQFGKASEGGVMARRYDLAPAREPLLPAPELHPVPQGDWTELLLAEVMGFGARAAIGSTDLMNHALATAGLEIPLWLDYFGDPMAERQMLALRNGSDAGLVEQWSLVAPALARGDRFSGCSADQCAALLGQLGAVGRLNRFTVREQLVQELPPWIELIPIDIECEALVRGPLVPPDAFLIVQTGGFNTWLDVETLFAALELAMAADARVHFAATGGAIPGHHESGFEWFERAVSDSRFRDRFHLLGWLPLGQVPRVIGEGDLGLNVDLDCPEGRLGTRNRLLDWLVGGLPVVSTPGCELARQLAAREFLTLAPHGDPARIAQAIAHVAAQPKVARQHAQDGADWLHEARAAQVSLEPLLKWAAAPKSASDLQAWGQGIESPPSLLVQALDVNEAIRHAQREAQRRAWLERRLAKLEGSRLVRWALALRGRHGLDDDSPPKEL